jgi:hypothetical protein
MAEPRGSWINYLGGAAGLVILALGIFRLVDAFSFIGSFLAVLGFLIAGWAVLDHRRYRRGLPESEVDGGRTIE